MLRNTLSKCKSTQVNKIIKACVSTESKQKWDLFTSVCLERKPVIAQALNKLELEFQNYLSQLELERSLKSNHEIRHENDKKQLALLKKAENTDLDIASTQTAQDFEDACTEELNKFKLASQQTEADKKNDINSLERQLDRYLIFLIKQKIGSKDYFLPPQGRREDGESLKQTAERVLKSTCGNDIKAQIFGNAPVGFYKYKYPKSVQQNGAVGAKIFIYFARHLKGSISSTADYKWLNRSELQKEMPVDYYKSMAKFLIDETHVNKNV